MSGSPRSASRPQSLGRAPASSSSAISCSRSRAISRFSVSVGNSCPARRDHAGADARYGWHLCRRQHLLVAADSDPDRNGGRGRARPRQFDWQSRGLAGPSIVGVIKQATDSFTAALLFLAGAMALGGVIALLFGRTARAGASPSPAIPRAGEQLRFSGIRRRGREFVYALLRFWRLACPRRRLLPTEARP